MKKIYCIITITLFFILAISCSRVEKQNNDEQNMEYSIDEEYIFPITRESNEWKELDTHLKKIAETQIPENILKELSTAALLETILNYPMISNIAVHGSKKQGIEVLKEEFNGLAEFYLRADAMEVLDTKRIELEGRPNQEEQEVILKLFYIEFLYEGFEN